MVLLTKIILTVCAALLQIVGSQDSYESEDTTVQEAYTDPQEAYNSTQDTYITGQGTYTTARKKRTTRLKLLVVGEKTFVSYALPDYLRPGYRKCNVLNCPDPSQHTMCLYAEDRINRTREECQGPHLRAGLTNEQKDFILDEHNRLRNKVALGQHSNYPKASNMQKLTWYEEIARYAQRWAYQCVYAYDICRNVFVDYRKACVGQNIIRGEFIFNVAKPSMKKALKKAIQSWFREGEHLQLSQIDGFKSVYGEGKRSVGHFTQMIWANTSRIGCGLVGLRPDKEMAYQKFHLICNYFGTGNVVGEPIYKKGEPRTDCKFKKIENKNYPGLCPASDIDVARTTTPDPKRTSHAFTANADLAILTFFVLLQQYK